MSDIRILITDLNRTYPEDMVQRLDLGEECSALRISMTDISGRNMYCSDEACEEIRSRLSELSSPESGIHFIDTGNYHYMSRIFTSFIKEKYDLILIDNHNDMQRAGFGDILSCGSWALDVLEKDSNLGTLYVYGPASFEAEGEDCGICIKDRNVSGRMYRGRGYDDSPRPLYLSVDKDVLAQSECVTNWDQGTLSVEELIGLIKVLTQDKKLIGADICGGISESDPGCTGETLYENTRSDAVLCREIIKLNWK